MSQLATITRSGRAAFAAALAAKPLHLAWGTGDPAWESNPSSAPSLINATALTAEVGRRLATQVAFVTPDEAGEIVIPTGMAGDVVQESRYSIVSQPSPYLYIRVAFDFADAANVTLRELALFSDTKTKADLPAGQRYFVPADIVDAGIMVAAQILDVPIVRSPSVRQTEEFVIAL
ncbi:MAG: hypothetical protein PHN64_04645 [Desulfovibrionaceae bacterium]|nr:hypothetical protein [Desulfovibrionaceae bacterium]